MRERQPMPGRPTSEQSPAEQTLSPEQRDQLKKYVALREKLNSMGSEILTNDELQRLGKLRSGLGDELIKKHVTAFEVNGPVL